MKFPKGLKWGLMIGGALIILLTNNLMWEFLAIISLFVGGIINW